MAEWIRGAVHDALTSAGSHVNTEETQLHNQTDNIFETSDLVIVDGFLTLFTDTDDLCGFRFVRQREDLLTADISETVPPENSSDIWYSMYTVRGPLVYRLPSKFTIYPEYKLWVTTWKEDGTTATVLHGGYRLLVQKKN